MANGASGIRAAQAVGALSWLLTLAPAGQPQAQSAGAPQPNLLLILVDDMGYGDWSAPGVRDPAAQALPLPALDRLAREGTAYTRAYVSQPVCSASRASLLTGCYANRLGIHGALGPNDKHGLPPDRQTLADLLRAAGYRTAIFGKWHLGHRPEDLPTHHGFDEFFGIPYSNDMWPRHPETPKGYPPLPLIEGERMIEENPDQRRFTGEFTGRAKDFIERSAALDQPWFVYLAHPMPHVPLHASAAFEGQSGRGLYADVLQEIDAGVGELLRTLDRLGQRENTLVLFTSDNGPWLSYGEHAGTTGGLREGKGTVFEGGVRVPAVARWPGHLPVGAVGHAPWMTIDVLPTLAGRLGLKPSGPLDGHDMWAAWSLERGAPEPLYAFYYGRGELQALLRGDWKLHLPHGYRTLHEASGGQRGQPTQYDYGVRTGLELYDLHSDPAELHDLAEQRPQIVLELLQAAWPLKQRLGDRLTGMESREGLR